MSVPSSASARRPLAGASVGIPPRNLKFQHDYLSSQRYPVAGNPFATAVIGVLSGIFPPGERFFVESVRHFRDRITDPELQAKVSGFIGQEALHGREHERLNEIFQASGLRVDIAERAVTLGLQVLTRFSPEQQLACTILMEHFTAIFGETFLRDRRFREQLDPEALKLWTWHALEELEHKSVAYDVYTQVSNSYRLKVQAVPLVLVTVLPAILGSLVAILAKDGQLKRHLLPAHARGAAMFFGRHGLFRYMPRRLPHFLQRHFHPDQDDTRALEAQWRETLFGEQALLAQEGGRALH